MEAEIGEGKLQAIGNRYLKQAEQRERYGDETAIAVALALIEGKMGQTTDTADGAIIARWIDKYGDVCGSRFDPALVEYCQRRAASGGCKL